MKAQKFVNYNSQTAIVNLPHTKYVDKVLRSSSFEELRELFINAESPAKEISESYAAFSNLKKVCNVSDSTWLHIGDGGWSRTAAIFTFFSKSVNYSIDPAISPRINDWVEKWKVLRFCALKMKYENFQLVNNPFSFNICCVHAHVDLAEVDQHFPNWTYLYSNPCCMPSKQVFSKEYLRDNNIELIVQRTDLGILSEKREVYIYKKNKI